MKNNILNIQMAGRINCKFSSLIKDFDVCDSYPTSFTIYNKESVIINTIEDMLSHFEIESEENIHNRYWYLLSNGKFILSESFMDKYFQYLGKKAISTIQKLSESFMDKHIDKLPWLTLLENQTMSKEFIEKHISRFAVDAVLLNQNVSKEFTFKYWDETVFLSIVKNCGESNRTIFRFKEHPTIVHIGCFSGTKKEAIEAIKKDYKEDPEAMQEYIDKVEECFNSTLID
jgi:hypothetical protein